MLLKAMGFWVSLGVTIGASVPVFAQKPVSVSASVERDVGRDRWTVTYRFSEPIFEARFLTTKARFRTEIFKIKTPDVFIEVNDNVEIMKTTNPNGVSEIQIEHPTLDREFHQTYQFHNRFGASDITVWTGYYYFENLRTSQGGQQIERLDLQFKKPNAGYVVVNGHRFDSNASWSATPKQVATLVYYGSIEPTLIKNFRILIDPSLPTWMATTFRKNVTAVLDFYSQQLFPLTDEIWVMVGYGGREDGLSADGGVVHGTNTVFVSPRGKVWSQDTSQYPRAFLKFIAHHLILHEFAHLWNMNDPGVRLAQPWLWEGGAETLAYEAPSKMNLAKNEGDPDYLAIAESMYLNNLGENFKKCLSSLQASHSSGADRLENYDFGYGCGHMIGILIDRALKKKGSSRDIFQFWSELLQTSRTQNILIDGKQFINAVENSIDDPVVLRAIQTLLYAPMTSQLASGKFLADALSHLGETFHCNAILAR